MKSKILAAIVVALFAGSGPAAADDVKRCASNWSNDYRSRVAACTRLIRSGRYNRRDLAQIYGKRGELYEVIGNHRQAYRDMTRAIRLNPRYYWHYHRRANFYSKHGSYRAALADYTAALRVNPQAAWTYATRANLYAKLGNIPAAIRDFRLAARYDPEDAADYYRRIRDLRGQS